METRTFEKTERQMSFDGESLLQINFGHATEHEEESTRLAEWVRDSFAEMTKGKSGPFYVIADMQNLDDSTSPSEEAKEIYSHDLLGNESIDHFVFVTKSLGMKMLLELLVTISGKRKRISVVHKMEETEELYKKWQKEK